MADHILSQFGIEPSDIILLRAKLRDEVLRYLLTWGHHEELLACVDLLLDDKPERVTLMDMRCRALSGMERHTEALETMQERQALRHPRTSDELRMELLLRASDSPQDITRLQEVIAEQPPTTRLLSLLVRAHLRQQQHDQAKHVCDQLRRVEPQGREYLISMFRYHAALGDQLRASAYAARLQQPEMSLGSLFVETCQELAAFYLQSGNRYQGEEIEEELEERQRTDRDRLRKALDKQGFTANRSQQVKAATPRRDSRPVSYSFTQLPSIEPTPAERRDVLATTRTLFGHEQLLPGQCETLAGALRGQDVLTILPTGGGKSLCYQLPAMASEQGTTLVISPLIALMKDQVESLPTRMRSQATTINSSLEGEELARRMRRVAAGDYRLVYAAPERLRQTPFIHALVKGGISRLVVDEAHCVSVWGHDFRPDYLYIGKARQALGNPSVLAMTATAPPRVRADIVTRLGSHDNALALVSAPVFRKNLFLQAVRLPNGDAKLARLVEIVRTSKGSGIVYINSRPQCESIAALLNSRGVKAGFYHAGIGDRRARAAAQDEFMNGKIRVMVATVAFGMGIDKSDIRFIVHMRPPNSLAAYYQEAGRAGRDGLPARCILLHTPGDRGTLTYFANRDAFSIDTLRDIYRVVSRRLSGATYGQIPMRDLAYATKQDESRVRVALGMLAEAGLLRRHCDLPHSSDLTLLADPVATSEAFRAFVRAAELVPQQSVSRSLVDLAAATGLAPEDIETQILEWSDKAWLLYRHRQHDVLIERLPAPSDASERIAGLLDEHASLQTQRVAEMVRYANTKHCRHDHLSAYLSGETVTGCHSCDNCAPVAGPRPKRVHRRTKKRP